MGKYNKASPFARKSFDTYYRLNPNSRESAIGYCVLIATLVQNDEFLLAEKYMGQTGGLEWAKRILGKTHPAIMTAARYTGVVWQTDNKFPAAEDLYASTLSDFKADPAADPVEILDLENFLAHLYAREGRFDKATSSYREVVKRALTIPATERGMRGAYMSLLAQCLLHDGSPGALKEAEGLLRESIRLGKILPSTHIERVNALIPMALVLCAEHRPAEAQPYWDEAIDIARHADKTEGQRWTTFARYAKSLREQGRAAEADALLDQETQTLIAAGADKALLANVRDCWAEIQNPKASAHSEDATTPSAK
jgi:tetratricopeptide (TPR) repeat protein